MFTQNLETRLNYIHINQKCFRKEDALLMKDDNLLDGQNVYLPASFLGLQRWASEQVSDCLTIATAFRPPTFFITMTKALQRVRVGQRFSYIFKKLLLTSKQPLYHISGPYVGLQEAPSH